MAEVVGLVASIIAVLELSAKVTKKCKSVIETAKDAPRDLRNILVEAASLNAALENLKFLSQLDCEFAEEISNQKEVDTAVKGCQNTLDDLATQLECLSFSDHRSTGPGKRAKIKTAILWTWNESATKKLLDDLRQYKITITFSLLTQTSRDINKMKAVVDDIQEIVSDEQRYKICSWLETTNPTNIHSTARANYESRTGEWMLRMPEWNLWLERHASARFLWVHGIPGAGKTVLASFLINECQRWIDENSINNSRCVYYYCSYRHNQNESMPLLRWLVSQLSRLTRHVSKGIYNAYQNNHYPTLGILKDALQELLIRQRTVYLFVDGVDESQQREKILSLLKDLMEDTRFCKLRLLATSRKYFDIDSVFSALSTPISMSNDEVDKDIRVYASARLDKTFTDWRAAHKPRVLEVLVHRAQGMFRLVACHIDILLRRKSLEEMKISLERLPPTIEETYDMIFLEIERQDWPLARAVLLWICANEKLPENIPIPVDTLLHVMSRRPEDPRGANIQYSKSSIQDLCGCLVAFDQVYHDDFRHHADDDLDNSSDSFDSARCAHYTVVEYLYSDELKRNPQTSYFALSVSDIAATFLETVLDVAKNTASDGLNTAYWTTFENYCARAAWLAPFTYESVIAESTSLMAVWRQVCLNIADYHSKLPQYFGYHRGYFFPEERSDRSITWVDSSIQENPQRSLVMLFISLIFNSHLLLAREFVGEYGVQILGVETGFMVRDSAEGPLGPVFLESHAIRWGNAIEIILYHTLAVEFWNETKMAIDFFENHVDKSTLLMICIGLHLHFAGEFQKCFLGGLDAAIISKKLRQWLQHHGVNSGVFQMTPLQLAVHCWDYEIVSILLENGVDPDGLGDRHGKLIPIHLYKINHQWGRASPLHVVRHAGFAPIELGFASRFIDERQRNRSRIEELLLRYGATDFGPSRGYSIHSLLN